jgi:exosome complex component RRP45
LRGAGDDDNDAVGSNFCVGNQKILRADGRRGTDVRKVRLQLGRWDNGAEVTVQWGAGTRVTSLCTAELVPPSPDRPNEGMVSFTVDLSPMAAPSFRLAPAISTGGQGLSGGNFGSRGSNYSDQDQRLLSNRILRCIERIILIGGALDTEALVLEGGKWVWKFTIALTVLDAGGNLLDACVLATVAALRHYRKPQVDLSADATTADEDPTVSTSDSSSIILPTMIPSTLKEATPLPLHHSPLSISFGLIPADDAVNSTSSTSLVAALIDPTDREELVQSGSLTIAMNIHSEVCLLDYGGGCELTPDKLKECCKVAEVAVKELCQLLEDTLTKADEQAQAERLRLLQLQTRSADELPPLPPAAYAPNIPFLQQLDDHLDVDASVDDTKVQQAKNEAEEAYRKQALDYASGHFATAVREDSDRDHSKNSNKAGSLLAAMLKSVGEKPATDTFAAMDTTEAASPAPVAVDATNSDNQTTKAHSSQQEVTAVEPAPKNTQPKKPTLMDLDDEDEEEVPMVLQSEFESVKNEEEPAKREAESAEPDIEDLSMAIKSKKNKKKKPKKK